MNWFHGMIYFLICLDGIGVLSNHFVVGCHHVGDHRERVVIDCAALALRVVSECLIRSSGLPSVGDG